MLKAKANHKQFFKELAALCDRHAVTMDGGIEVSFHDGMLKNNEPGTTSIFEGGSCEVTTIYNLAEIMEDGDQGVVVSFHAPANIQWQTVSVPVADHES